MKNFAGSGWVPYRSTLLNIKTAAAELVQPLVKFFADEVRNDDVVGTDDTGVTLLLPKVLPTIVPHDVRSQRIHEVLSAAFKDNKKHVKAKMWAYRGRTADLMTLVSSAIRNDLHVWPIFSNPHQRSARRSAGRLNGLPFPPPRHLGRQPS